MRSSGIVRRSPEGSEAAEERNAGFQRVASPAASTVHAAPSGIRELVIPTIALSWIGGRPEPHRGRFSAARGRILRGRQLA